MKKESVIKFYTTYRMFIFPVIVALSSLILIIFVILPQLMALLTNQKNASDLLTRSKSLEVKAAALETYDSSDLARKLDYALSSLPEDKDFATVLGLVQNLAIQSGFSVTSISLGSSGSAKAANAQSYSVKLDVIGVKSLLDVLFSNLEGSTRLMKVSNIEFTNTQKQQAVNASITLDILYLSLPTDFGNVDSSLPEVTDRDEKLIDRLAKNATPSLSSSANVSLPPRGRANPFE